MNLEYFRFIVSGIMMAGMGMSVCALVVTIILTIVQRPRLYYLMRSGMATAGFALGTFTMISWMVLSLFATSMNTFQIPPFCAGLACFSLPLFMGVCAALGPRLPGVLWLGRTLLYFVTPIAAFWIAQTIQFKEASESNRAEAMVWFIVYMVVTSVWWEALVFWDSAWRRQQRLPHELPA